MASPWKPPDTPMGTAPPAAGGWKPPDTPWKPPDTPEGGAAPPAEVPPGWGEDAARHIRARQELGGAITRDPIFGSLAAPAINLFTYPARALTGDAAVLASIPGSPAWIAQHLGIGPDVSPEKMQKVKEDIIAKTEVPTTRVGQAIEDIAAFPGTMIAKGVGAASRKILGDQLTEQLSPYAQTAADLLPFGAGKFLSRAPRELPLKPSERFAAVGRQVKEAQDIKAENAARKEISDRYARSSHEGGPNAQDISDRMAAGQRAGQPLTIADLNQSLQRLAGTLYRQGGAAAGRIKSFLDTRDAGAAARMEAKVDESLTDQSLRDAMKVQAEQRSANARPVWDKAMVRGTSTAIFERQYTRSWQEASKKESQARAAVAAAEREGRTKVAAAEAAETQRRARQITTTRPFEGTPMADLVEARKATERADQAATTRLQRVRQAASAKMVRAQAALEAAQKETVQIKELLRRAQEDGTLGAPGATWSPGLQRVRDAHPEIRAGINRGIQIMRLEATPDIMAGRGFNPRDYAIVGADAAGEPIIGAVPTMRLWHAAKVGLDSFLRSAEAHDPLTGRLNAIGRAYAIARKELVSELDRLNPAYKPARDLWAGDTAVLTALSEGKFAFDRKHFMDDQHLREHFDSLGESEKQGFITGMRQAISDMMDEVTARRDQSVTFDKPRIQKRLGAVLGEDGAKTLLDAAEREHLTKTTSNVTTRGSQTQERSVTDAERAMEQMKTLRRALEHLKSGHPVRAGTSLVGGAIEKAMESRLGDRSRARQDIVNDIIARHLIDPSLSLNPTGPLLSPVPTPPRTYPTPPMAYTLGTTLMPEDRSKHP